MDASLRAEIELLNDRAMWETAGPRRAASAQVEKDMASGMMVLVRGLRRTGKTYLVQQLLSQAKNPFYFSFDKMSFQKTEVLEEVVRHAISQGARPIALDEVQKVPQWSGVLKGYYDHLKPKPLFLLSGSSSIQLRKGAESLAGRVLETQLQPLSYQEYLRFRGIDAKFRKDYVQDYLAAGAFPEVALGGKEPSRYAQSVVDKIVGEDIPQLYSVEHPEHLPDIVRILAERCCGMVDYRDIGSAIGLSKDTVKRYVLLLEKSFLLDVVRMHGRYGSVVGKSKKVYFAHPQLASAYLPQAPGAAAESAVFSALRFFGSVGFFRNGRQEIDFVLQRGTGILPVEVKFQQSIRASDTRALRSFAGKKKCDALMITKGDMETIAIGAHKLEMVPLHEFLFNPAPYLGLEK